MLIATTRKHYPVAKSLKLFTSVYQSNDPYVLMIEARRELRVQQKKEAPTKIKSIARASDRGRLVTRRERKSTAADNQLKKAWAKTYANRNQKKIS
jgi:hypothetical protein